MRFSKQLLLAASLFAVGLVGTSANAQSVGPYCSSGFPYAGWGGYFSSPYATGRIPTPPYFALHPPVYYSAPVARTYGYSPYAYPGSVRTPEIVAPQSAMIHNPYISPESEQKISHQDTVVEAKPSPKMIQNPYVDQDKRTVLTGSDVY